MSVKRPHSSESAESQSPLYGFPQPAVPSDNRVIKVSVIPNLGDSLSGRSLPTTNLLYFQSWCAGFAKTAPRWLFQNWQTTDN